MNDEIESEDEGLVDPNDLANSAENQRVLIRESMPITPERRDMTMPVAAGVSPFKAGGKPGDNLDIPSSNNDRETAVTNNRDTAFNSNGRGTVNRISDQRFTKMVNLD
jgi:hypothetical protein